MRGLEINLLGHKFPVAGRAALCAAEAGALPPNRAAGILSAEPFRKHRTKNSEHQTPQMASMAKALFFCVRQMRGGGNLMDEIRVHRLAGLNKGTTTALEKRIVLEKR